VYYQHVNLIIIHGKTSIKTSYLIYYQNVTPVSIDDSTEKTDQLIYS